MATKLENPQEQDKEKNRNNKMKEKAAATKKDATIEPPLSVFERLTSPTLTAELIIID